MLKITVSFVPARLVCPKANENELGTDGSGGISGSKIDDRLANLSNSMKKKSSGSGFPTSEASLAFTQWKKAFTEALILHHFDPEHHIRITTNALGYFIRRELSHLTTEKGLAG